MRTLAEEFGVTVMTIRNDITELSFDYPIVTTRGNGGGVRLVKELMRQTCLLSQRQKQAIEAAIPLVDANHATELVGLLYAKG